MTGFAFHRDPGSGMIRQLSCVKFRLMTTFTFHGSTGISCNVATGAISRSMCTGQWKITGIVIECYFYPVC